MLTVTEDSKALDRLGTAIRAYKIASGRTLTFAMIKTGRELAYALHKETKKHSPTQAMIRDLPEALGWRIKRRSGKALKEIERRQRHVGFVQAGWLPAIRGFGNDRETKFVHTNIKQLGAVVAQTNDNGDVSITLINRTPPAKKMMEKYGIIKTAVTRVRLGFAPYIKRKLGDDAVKAFSQL